jgi:putative hemolysin
MRIAIDARNGMSITNALTSHLSGSARVAGVLVLCGLAQSALARPGFANLINSYCREQGAARVRYTDDGCTLCHHRGTFVSDAEHRVEPVWTEFAIGRTSGDYSFFCPVGGASSAATALANAADAVVDAAPKQGRDTAHVTMAWMALGYPTGHIASVEMNPQGQEIPPTLKPVAAPGVESAQAVPRPKAASVESAATAELKRNLAKLHGDLGIVRAQESGWQELQDAVLDGAVNAPKTPDGADLQAVLQNRQRVQARRIAQLRAVNTAVIRLNAQLDPRQKRLLGLRLPPLIAE